MTVRDLLAELDRRGVKLAAAGERLRYRPRDAVSPELRAAIIEHKPELLARVAEEEAEARSRVDAACDPPSPVYSPAAPSLVGQPVSTTSSASAEMPIAGKRAW